MSHKLACEIKHTLVAPPGHTLILADLAGIEARGLAWITRQDDLTEAFRQNRDVYSEFAAEALAAPCRKPRKDDPKPVYKLYSGRRALGKVGILGMGYGMGADRALEYMESYPELEPKIESGEIDLMFCKRFVDAYRNKYTKVPLFWRNLENAFRFVTKYRQSQSLWNLTLSREDSTTKIMLPSGRCLFYPHAQIAADGRIKFKGGPKWCDLWGGTLTENVVQAISRDLLAEAILDIEAHGFPVAHHVYDSVVVVAPNDQDTLAYACVNECLTRERAWAKGWPLGVETTVSSRYE